MAVYNGKEPYIFVSYAHSDSKIVLPIIEKMQKAGFRIWYDNGIEAGTEWPQYIAEHLADASCVLMFLSPNSADSHNCRNEINLAADLKKEFLVVHVKDFELPLGLKLQLNSYQALFKSNFKTDTAFFDSLAGAKILQKYRSRADEQPADIAEKTLPKKTSRTPKILLVAISAVALLAVLFPVIIGGSANKKSEATQELPSSQTATESSTLPKDETIILKYNEFYDNLIAVTDKMGTSLLWKPSTLIDNYKLDQGDGDVWTTYYTNSFTLENTSLHIGFRNEGVEIIAVLNSFEEKDLDNAYNLLESISSAVDGYYFTDFNELMTNDDRVAWRTLEEPHSIWNEVLELEEPAFLKVDENSETETVYKKISVDDLVIYIERRARVYNGQKYFDFTVLYEHPDNLNQ